MAGTEMVSPSGILTIRTWGLPRRRWEIAVFDDVMASGSARGNDYDGIAAALRRLLPEMPAPAKYEAEQILAGLDG